MLGKFMHLGFGHYVFVDKVVSVHPSKSNPIKHILREAEKQGKVMDATMGRATRSVVLTTCNQLLLSSIDTPSLLKRAEFVRTDKKGKPKAKKAKKVDRKSLPSAVRKEVRRDNRGKRKKKGNK